MEDTDDDVMAVTDSEEDLHPSEIRKRCMFLHNTKLTARLSTLEYSKIGMMLPTPRLRLLVETIHRDFSEHSGVVAPWIVSQNNPIQGSKMTA